MAVRISHLASSSLVSRRIGSVRRVLVASPNYLARRGVPAVPDDLARHEIVLFVSQASNADWRFTGADGSERTIRVSARFQVDRAEAAIAATREGRGILAALSYQVAPDLASGALVRVLDRFKPPPIPVHLIYPGGRLITPRLRAFLDYATPRLSQLNELRQPG